MYRPHRAAVAPTNPYVPLWRYMDFAKFVQMLESSSLYFPRLDRMSDPFEGALSSATLPHIERFYAQTGLADEGHSERWHVLVKEQYVISRLMFYVNCWHMNEHESVAMWDLYSAKGIAVRSTFARLCESFAKDPDEQHVGQVRYIGYGTEVIDYGNTMNAIYTKRTSFEHEREVRACLSRIPEDWKAGTPDAERYAKSQPAGVYVSVDLATLVDSVYVSPGRPGWFRDLVASMMRRYELDKPVEASSLDERPDLV